MAGVNKCILIGNLGRDPEVKTMDTGRKVANFPLATTETYKDKDGNKQEQTEWHNVVFWGPIAETIEKYLKKGSQTFIEGKLRTRSYQDKEGQTRYITEILGDKLTMLGSGAGRSSAPVGPDPGTPAGYKAPINQQAPAGGGSFLDTADDDLPF